MTSKGYIMAWNIPRQLLEGLIYFFAHHDDDFVDFPAILAWNIPSVLM